MECLDFAFFLQRMLSSVLAQLNYLKFILTILKFVFKLCWDGAKIVSTLGLGVTTTMFLGPLLNNRGI